MTDVTFDAVSDCGTRIENTNTKTWNHAGGSPTAVAICFGTNVNGGVTGSRVRYGGVDCTLASDGRATIGAKNVEIWGLANPPAGTQAVIVDLTGNDYGWCFAVSVTNSDPAQCFTSSKSNTGTSSAPSTTCVAEVGGLMVDALDVATGTITPDSEQTQRGPTGFDGVSSTLVTTEPADATSETLSYSLGASVAFAHVVASFKPAPAGGGGGNTTGFGQFIQVTA